MLEKHIYIDPFTGHPVRLSEMGEVNPSMSNPNPCVSSCVKTQFFFLFLNLLGLPFSLAVVLAAKNFAQGLTYDQASF